MSSPRTKIGGKKTVYPSKAGASSVAKPLLTPCPSHLQELPNGQKACSLAQGMCPSSQSLFLSLTAVQDPRSRSPSRTTSTTSLVSATKLRRESKTPPLAQSVPSYRQEIRKTLLDSQSCSLTIVIGIAHYGSDLEDLLMRLLVPSRNRSRQSNNPQLLLLMDHNERRANQSSLHRAGNIVIGSIETHTVSQCLSYRSIASIPFLVRPYKYTFLQT